MRRLQSFRFRLLTRAKRHLASINVAAYLTVLLAFLGSANVVGAEPQTQDFREIPLKDRQDIIDGKVKPHLDLNYLSAQTDLLLRGLGYGARGHIAKPLTYHLTVRSEGQAFHPVPEGFAEFKNVEFPANPSESASKVSDDDVYLRLVQAAERAVSDFATVADVTPERDPKTAQLLIHLNLADRSQTAKGFGFNAMPKLPERRPEIADLPGLKYVLVVMPWTLARVYFDESKGNSPQEILGGEVWIDYPVRTFWQEKVASIALDNLQLASRLGLGQTSTEVKSKFVSPSETALPPLRLAVSQIRQDLLGHRPNSNLLTVASTSLLVGEGYLREAEEFGQRAGCEIERHSVSIEARLFRALAIFRTGLRFGGYVLVPGGDEMAEFERDQTGNLARYSLNGYKTQFDELLRDRLAKVILSKFSSKSAQFNVLSNNYSERRREAISSLLKDDASAVAGALSAVANLLEPTATCLSKFTLENVAYDGASGESK